MLMYHPIAIDHNLYAVVSYSETSYRKLNDVVSYPVNLYRNLNDVVSYPVTIHGIQEIVMSYHATVYYSRDAEHFMDIFTAIYKFFCGPISSFYIKDQIFLPFHIQCTSTCWIRTIHIPEARKRYPFRGAPPRIGHYGRTPPPPPPPTVDPESSSLLGVFTNFVTNSSKIEGKWIVSSKGKIPKTFCHKMALRTDQNPWVILLLLHQTFAPKECIKRLDSVKKKIINICFLRLLSICGKGTITNFSLYQIKHLLKKWDLKHLEN